VPSVMKLANFRILAQMAFYHIQGILVQRKNKKTP